MLLLDTWEKVAMMYNNRQKPREVKKCFKKVCKVLIIFSCFVFA